MCFVFCFFFIHRYFLGSLSCLHVFDWFLPIVEMGDRKSEMRHPKSNQIFSQMNLILCLIVFKATQRSLFCFLFFFSLENVSFFKEYLASVGGTYYIKTKFLDRMLKSSYSCFSSDENQLKTRIYIFSLISRQYCHAYFPTAAAAYYVLCNSVQMY